MTFSRMVPAVVPSLLQSPWLTPSSARKNSMPPARVSSVGYELPEPGLMSLTRTVPAGVPSVFHSSTPLVPSSAVKNTVPFASVN